MTVSFLLGRGIMGEVFCQVDEGIAIRLHLSGDYLSYQLLSCLVYNCVFFL